VRRYAEVRIQDLGRRLGLRHLAPSSGCHGHPHEVAGLLLFARRYFGNRPRPIPPPDDDANCHAATGDYLALYTGKLVHCRNAADLEALLTRLQPALNHRADLGLYQA